MSAPNRSAVESLHREMMQASVEAANLDRRLQDHAARGDGLAPVLRSWAEAARHLKAAVASSTAQLVKDGSPEALVKQSLTRLEDLHARATDLDVSRELDESVRSWQALGQEFAALQGVRAQYLVSLLGSRQGAIDLATRALSEARANAGVDPALAAERRTLQSQRDGARRKYEEIRQRYLAAEREFNEDQKHAAAAAQAKPASGLKQHVLPGGLVLATVAASAAKAAPGKAAPTIVKLAQDPRKLPVAGTSAPSAAPRPAAPKTVLNASGGRVSAVDPVAPFAKGADGIADGIVTVQVQFAGGGTVPEPQAAAARGFALGCGVQLNVRTGLSWKGGKPHDQGTLTLTISATGGKLGGVPADLARQGAARGVAQAAQWVRGALQDLGADVGSNAAALVRDVGHNVFSQAKTNAPPAQVHAPRAPSHAVAHPAGKGSHTAHADHAGTQHHGGAAHAGTKGPHVAHPGAQHHAGAAHHAGTKGSHVVHAGPQHHAAHPAARGPQVVPAAPRHHTVHAGPHHAAAQGPHAVRAGTQHPAHPSLQGPHGQHALRGGTQHAIHPSHAAGPHALQAGATKPQHGAASHLVRGSAPLKPGQKLAHHAPHAAPPPRVVARGRVGSGASSTSARVVRRLDAGRFSEHGEDGIARGSVKTTVVLQWDSGVPGPIGGVQTFDVGCGVTLSVAPSLQLSSAGAEGHYFGELSLSVASSGGHLGRLTPAQARQSAEHHASDVGGKLTDRFRRQFGAAAAEAVGHAVSRLVSQIFASVHDKAQKPGHKPAPGRPLHGRPMHHGPAQHGRPLSPAAHAAQQQHHAHKMNASFSEALERARKFGHHAPGHHAAGGLTHFLDRERDGVANRLQSTMQALSLVSHRGLVDAHGSELRSGIAKMDALIGKLQGKRGAELAQGAEELQSLLGHLGSVAQSKGGAPHLGAFRKLLQERKGLLGKVMGGGHHAGPGHQGGHHAGHHGGSFEGVIKMAGGLLQPSAFAQGGKGLEQVKKLFPGLEHIIKGAAHGELAKLAKASGPELHRLARVGLGIAQGKAGALHDAHKLVEKGLLGVGTGLLGKLSGGHLGGFGGGGHGGALGQFSGGKLNQALLHAGKPVAKTGAQEVVKVLAAFQKGGQKGAMGEVHKLVALHQKHISARLKHLDYSKLTQQGLAGAFHAAGKPGLAEHLLPGGALGSILKSAQSSHGMGLGGLVAQALHPAASSKMSAAVRLVEGLKKKGHKPRFSLWGAISSRVSAAASNIASAVAGPVSRVTNLVQATVSTVRTSVSSVAQAASNVASRVTSAVGHVVQRGVGAVSNVAHRVGSAVGNAAHRVGSAVGNVAHRVGSAVGNVAHRVGGAIHSGLDSASSFVSQQARALGRAAGGAWDHAKQFANDAYARGSNIAHNAWDRARRVAQGASNFAHRAWDGASALANRGVSAYQNASHWVHDKAAAIGNTVSAAAHKGWGMLGKVGSWMGDKVSGAAGWVGQKAGGAWNAIKSGAAGASSWVADKAKGAAGWVAQHAKGAGSWIGEKVKGGLDWAKRTGIVGALGAGLKKGISFLGKAAEYTPLGFLAKKGFDFVKGGGLGKLWNKTKEFGAKAWGGIKSAGKAVGGFLQSPAGQLLVTGLSLAANFIPGGPLVKGLIGGAVGAITAISEGKDWKGVLLSAGAGALTAVVPMLKLGPLAKIGINALTSGVSTIAQGGSLTDGLKSAAGGALDAVGPGAFKALSKMKGLGTVAKVLTSGPMKMLEKGGAKGPLGVLEQAIANPKVRKMLGGLEKVGSKVVKGGVWVSGKAGKVQEVMEKALAIGDKIQGGLGAVAQYAPGVAEFVGDNAVGRFINKVGDTAGKGQEKLQSALDYGHTASDKLGEYKGYLDKGLGHVGVKDPAKAYARMQKEKKGPKTLEGATHHKGPAHHEGDRKGPKKPSHALAETVGKGRKPKRAPAHHEAGPHPHEAPASGRKTRSRSESPRHARDPEGHDAHKAPKKGKADHHDEHGKAHPSGKTPRNAAKGKGHPDGKHGAPPHEPSAHPKPSSKKGKVKKSALEKALAKGKDLQKKAVAFGNKVDKRATQLHDLVGKGLDGAKKIQAGLEKASELAEKGSELLGEDNELGHYLHSLHERAEEVHGYLETGISYGEKVNEGIEKGQEFLHKVPGVGEESEGGESEGSEAGAGKGKKKKSKKSSPLEQATHLGEGGGHGKKPPRIKAGHQGEGPHDAAAAKGKKGKKGHPDGPNAAPPEKKGKSAGDLTGDLVVKMHELEALGAQLGVKAERHAGDPAMLAKTLQQLHGLFQAKHAAVVKLAKELQTAAVRDHVGGGIPLKVSGDAFRRATELGEHVKSITAHIPSLHKEAQEKAKEEKTAHEVHKQVERIHKHEVGEKKKHEASISGAHKPLPGEKAHKDHQEHGHPGKHPAGKEHGHGEKGHGKDHSPIGGKIEHGLKMIDSYRKRAVKFGGKVDKGLIKAEGLLKKGIKVGKQIDGALVKAAGLANQLGDFLGDDSPLGHLAHQAGHAADAGHDKLHGALNMANKGKSMLHKGRGMFEQALNFAKGHHEEKTAKGVEEHEKHSKKEMEHIEKELVHRGHPDAHPHAAHHRGHPSAGHGGHHEAHGRGHHGGLGGILGKLGHIGGKGGVGGLLGHLGDESGIGRMLGHLGDKGGVGGMLGHLGGKGGLGGLIGGAASGFGKGGLNGALGGIAGHLPKHGFGGIAGGALTGFGKGGWMGALGGAAGHMPKGGPLGVLGGAMGGFAQGGWMGALGGAAGHMPKHGPLGVLGGAMGGFAKGGWMGALGGAAGHMPKSGIGGMIGGAMGGFAKGGWMGALGGAAGHLPKTGLGGYLGSAMGGFATGGVGGALTGLAGHLPKTGLGGFAGSALNGFATGGLTGAITGALGHLHVPQIAIGPLTKLAQMGLDRFSKAVGKAIPAIEKLLHTSDHKGAEGKVHGVSSLMELARQAITTLINAAMHDPAHKKQAEALRKAFFEIRAHFQKFVGMLHGLGGELAGGIDAKKYPVLAAIEAAIHALATKAGTLGDAGHADSKQAGAVALLHKAADALHKRLTAAQGKFKKDQAAQAIISGLLAKLGECLAHIGGKGKKGKKTEGDHAQAGGGAHAGHGEGGGGAHGGHPHSGEHPNAHRPKKHKKRKPRRHHRHGRGRGNASHQIAVGGSHGGGDPVGELIGDLQQETGRVFVDRGANRGEGDHSDGQDVDASAGDTWLGSGEGIKNFSDVFGAFLPAEGASKGGGHGKAGHGGHGGGHGGKGHGHGGGAGHQASGEHGEHGGEEHEAHGEGGGGEEGDESGYETPEDGELVEHDGGQGEEGGEGEGGESGEHGGGEGGVGGGGEAPEHGPGGGKGKGGKRRRGKGGGWLGKLKKFGKKVGKLGKVGKFAKKMIGKVTGAFGKGGFFNKLFKGLHGFADKVGKYAKLGQGLLGKGMHYAEMGMGMLDKFGGIAQKVEGFAGKAEGFLDKVGLHGLAGLAGKVGGAAGWASEKSSAGHDLLQKADDLMGQGKKGLGAAGGFAGKAGKAFGAAEHGSFGKLLHLFKASRFGNGIDGKYSPERFKGGSQLDEAKRLDGSTRNRMEEFLGGDFGGVKIHTGQGAAEVTRRYDAEAVTVKDHIFFAPGRFNPNTADGERLIAHELTHVLQKGRPNLDVKTAEGEALHSERAYGNGPARETLNLGKPKADFAFSDGEGAGAATGVHTAKRTRSKGNEGGGQDQTPDGEEFIEKISARVYELLMEELEQAFESR